MNSKDYVAVVVISHLPLSPSRPHNTTESAYISSGALAQPYSVRREAPFDSRQCNPKPSIIVLAGEPKDSKIAETQTQTPASSEPESDTANHAALPH